MEKKVKVGQQSLLGYLPAIVIKNILDGNIDYSTKLPTFQKMTTVSLFADISGFTKLSEVFSKKGRMGSEFLAFCLNRYMEQLINIISKDGGDIFKFAGDALLVVWPEDKNSNLEDACRRAVQCALTIQSKLNKLEMSPGKQLSVKIGLGVGDCRILFVGGQFKRCEYLIVGEAMRQACEAETHCLEGGETIVSENVYRLIKNHYDFQIAKGDGSHGPEDPNAHYYKVMRTLSGKVASRADAYLMRTHFDSEKLREKMALLKTFVPAAITTYLEIEKESWSKELRLLTIMFLNLKVDLSQTNTEEGMNRIQEIVRCVQRCVYRTKGSLNKFLMDDKGSVMLCVWGLPPLSASDDHTRSVLSALDIVRELKKFNCGARIGITTGCCFTGVCGNIGGRREYSLLGEIVNLAARYMQTAMKLSEKAVEKKKESGDYLILICEPTKNLIQNKIHCEFYHRCELKGFELPFNFYEPKFEIKQRIATDKKLLSFLPDIKTHRDNVLISGVSEEEEKLRSINSTMANALYMAGRKQLLANGLMYLENMHKNKTREIVLIRGAIGSGKSLYLRKLMYEFIERNHLKQKLFTSKYPFIFISSQLPTSLCNPMNGFGKILKEIYNILRTSTNQTKSNIDFKLGSEYVTINCDVIGEILLNSNCLSYVKYIEEILDSSFDQHYQLTEDSLFSKFFQIREIPTRDIFFEARKYDKLGKNICKFFIEMIIRYRENLIPDDPLIFIIEDAHQIDSISVELMREIVSPNGPKRVIVLTSYQDALNPIIKNPNDNLYRINELFDVNRNIFTLEGLEERSDIVELLLHNCRERRINIDKISDKLINHIMSKSFKGNPLFLIEIVNSLIEQKFVAHPSNELTVKSELEEMYESSDWSRFRIPILIEKILGNIIDSLSCKEIILLKVASVIGNTFDIDKLNDVNPFNSVTFDDLLSIIYNLESYGIIEILYDLNPKHLICKFSIPFLREVCYQRMLVEHKNDLHLNVARKMQYNKFSYMPHAKEVSLLRHHLRTTEKTILAHMEDNPNDVPMSTNSTELTTNNQKIVLVKDICERLKIIDRRIESDEIEISRRSMPIIKSGLVSKKSDHGPTWEDRYVVVTNTKFLYWYKKDDYIQSKQSLGSFDLKNLYLVKTLRDREVGDRCNLINLHVSSWYKKEENREARSYIFSCHSREELHSWVITFNFLRVKAIYDEFTSNFGLINLPLNHEIKGRNKKKIKRKFHPNTNWLSTNKSNKVNSGSIYSSIARKSMMAGKKTSSASKNSHGRNNSLKKQSLKNTAEVQNEDIEQEKISRIKEMLTNVIEYGFTGLLGFVQDIILNLEVIGINEERVIRIPDHLSTFRQLTINRVGSTSNEGIMTRNSIQQINNGIDEENSYDEDDSPELKSKILNANEENGNMNSRLSFRNEGSDTLAGKNLNTDRGNLSELKKQFTLNIENNNEVSNFRQDPFSTSYNTALADKLKRLSIQVSNDELDEALNSLSLHDSKLSSVHECMKKENEYDNHKPQGNEILANLTNSKFYNQMNVTSSLFKK